ncbi:MAG: hypothetical protein CMM38_05535 [Rhodospirillaceae bacterium]|nr:hypothetical protein [Rhodospirillaceae bacterium]|tara:strand:+ start:155 stop:655 length:501 start_codon:yes stop_codon:yes gene_type:complete
MAAVISGFVHQNDHPLDLVETTIAVRDWPLERPESDELFAQVTGRWSSYDIMFNWMNDLGALQIICSLDIRAPKERRSSVHELLAILNDRLGVGHFDIGLLNGTPSFRHTLLLRGGGLSAEQIEDLVDIALFEIDRFYPAFQYVVWGGQSPADAIATVVFETVGEA